MGYDDAKVRRAAADRDLRPPRRPRIAEPSRRQGARSPQAAQHRRRLPGRRQAPSARRSGQRSPASAAQTEPTSFANGVDDPLARRQGQGHPRRERAAGRRPAGVGRRLRRHRRHRRRARHRRRRHPPGSRGQIDDGGQLRARTRTRRTSTATAPTSRRRSRARVPPPTGANKGVAPGANLIVGKVLGDDGYGQDSWMLAGMQWAAESGADVVSMSLGDSIPVRRLRPDVDGGRRPLGAVRHAVRGRRRQRRAGEHLRARCGRRRR